MPFIDTDTHSYANSNTYTDANSDANSNSDAYAYAYAYTNSDAHVFDHSRGRIAWWNGQRIINGNARPRFHIS